MVKVLGFFASKKSSTLTKKLSTAKTLPIVVVRAGNTTSEIIRLENEKGNMGDVTCQQFESAGTKMLTESFEEVLGEIDKEIKKFDSRASVAVGFKGNKNEEKVTIKCDLQASRTAGFGGNMGEENEEKETKKKKKCFTSFSDNRFWWEHRKGKCGGSA